MIRLACPACKGHLEVMDNVADQTITCPQCGQRLQSPTPTLIRFACPTCQKRLKAPDHGAGRKTSCPRCGQRLLIPPPLRDKTVLGQVVPPVPVPGRLAPMTTPPEPATLEIHPEPEPLEVEPVAAQRRKGVSRLAFFISPSTLAGLALVLSLLPWLVSEGQRFGTWKLEWYDIDDPVVKEMVRESHEETLRAEASAEIAMRKDIEEAEEEKAKHPYLFFFLGVCWNALHVACFGTWFGSLVVSLGGGENHLRTGSSKWPAGCVLS